MKGDNLDNKCEKKMISHLYEWGKSCKVYCKRDHQIKYIDFKDCLKCPYFEGDFQGEGIECRWEDYAPIDANSYRTDDEVEELRRVSKLINDRKI